MICDTCRNECDSYTRKATRSGMKTVCRRCQTGRSRPSVYNPFCDLELTHVRDANDRPIRVTSLRQLREVEKQHKCVSLVANADEKHFDEPPQHKPGSAFKTMSEQNRWLYPDVAEEMLRDMRASGEIQ
jgi:hypothetical protein